MNLANNNLAYLLNSPLDAEADLYTEIKSRLYSSNGLVIKNNSSNIFILKKQAPDVKTLISLRPNPHFLEFYSDELILNLEANKLIDSSILINPGESIKIKLINRSPFRELSEIVDLVGEVSSALDYKEYLINSYSSKIKEHLLILFKEKKFNLLDKKLKALGFNIQNSFDRYVLDYNKIELSNFYSYYNNLELKERIEDFLSLNSSLEELKISNHEENISRITLILKSKNYLSLANEDK